MAEAVDVPGVIEEICFLLDVPRDVEIDVQPQWPEMQKAAQDLGGSVRLDSTLGQGSTFIVNLPTSILENGKYQNYREF